MNSPKPSVPRFRWPRESMSDGLRPLPRHKEMALREVCGAEGVTGPVVEKVVKVAQMVQSHMEDEARKRRTPEALYDDLGRISARAEELFRLLAGLQHFDRERLDGKMEAAMAHMWGGVRAANAHRFQPILHDLQQVCLAAKALQADVAPKRKGAGRTRTSSDRTLYVALLWWAVSDTGISFGRGGAFGRLCAALFSAVGVPAEADSAIRKTGEAWKRGVGWGRPDR